MRWSVFKAGVNKPHSLDRDDVFGGRALWIARLGRRPLPHRWGARPLYQNFPTYSWHCDLTANGRDRPKGPDRATGTLYLVLLCVPPGGRLRLELANDLRIAQRGHVSEVMALGNVPEQAPHDLPGPGLR